MESFLEVLDDPRNENRGEKIKINKTFNAADHRRRAADKKSDQSALSSWGHLQCIVGKLMDFPNLKTKQAISYLEANWRVVRANREPDLSAV